MQGTMTAQRTGTALAARYVSSRVLGDLLSIHEKFHIGTKKEMRDLVHDLELGLVHDCLSSLRLCLYTSLGHSPTRVYVYERVAIGSFAPSSHSGRITYSPELFRGKIEYEISLRDRSKWEALKLGGQLQLIWSPCNRQSIAGMTATADGGYASGDLGLSRTMYMR